MISRVLTFRSFGSLAGLIAVCACTAPAFGVVIAADYHVPFTPETADIGCFPAKKKPTVVVPSGAIVSIDGAGGVRYGRIATPAAGTGANPAAKSAAIPTPTAADVDAWLKENHLDMTVATCPALAETLAVLKDAPRAPGFLSGHLLNGPVYVEGAEPGDTLEIRILDVTPRIPYGTVGGRPGGGGLRTTPRASSITWCRSI